MPDTRPENASTKQQIDASEDVSTSPKSSDVDGPKKVMIRSKDEPESSEGSLTPPRSSSVEQTTQPRKKPVKRAASPAKERIYMNRERAKKNSTKEVSSNSTEGTTLVNGEAEVV